MKIKARTCLTQGFYQVQEISFVQPAVKMGVARKHLRGDVLMEYVILMVCIIPVLVGVQAVFAPDGNAYASTLFNPAGEPGGQFGLVGNAFHSSYTNIVLAVSQPTP